MLWGVVEWGGGSRVQQQSPDSFEIYKTMVVLGIFVSGQTTVNI